MKGPYKVLHNKFACRAIYLAVSCCVAQFAVPFFLEVCRLYALFPPLGVFLLWQPLSRILIDHHMQQCVVKKSVFEQVSWTWWTFCFPKLILKYFSQYSNLSPTLARKKQINILDMWVLWLWAICYRML